MSTYSSSSSKIIDINLNLDPRLYQLLLSGACDAGNMSLDFMKGMLAQFIWDESSFLRDAYTFVAARTTIRGAEELRLLTGTAVKFTINNLPLENFPELKSILRSGTSMVMSGMQLPTQSDMDNAYWNGSPAYRNGRHVGRALSVTFSIFEIAGGAAAALAAFNTIPPTAGATGLGCFAFASGVGTVGCGLGGAALTVEVGLVIGGAIAVAHGTYTVAHYSKVDGGGKSSSNDPTLSYGTNAGQGHTARNARTLRQNMINSGENIPSGYAAHHIVPSTHSYSSAQEAREILHRFGIDINDAANGVALHPSVHTPIHSHAYMDEVVRRLRNANSSQDAYEILDEIRQLILTGKIP